jgi:hypothetical protein
MEFFCFIEGFLMLAGHHCLPIIRCYEGSCDPGWTGWLGHWNRSFATSLVSGALRLGCAR